MSEVLGNIEINRFVNVEVRGPKGTVRVIRDCPRINQLYLHTSIASIQSHPLVYLEIRN